MATASTSPPGSKALADPGGVLVSNTVHDHVRDRLALVFEDWASSTSRTSPGRCGSIGFASDSPPTAGVPLSRMRGGCRARRAGEADPPLALPDKPSIAVLPFANMSGDPEQEYFADGMVEEIITALSRIRWLFVIARNSSFTYKGPGRRCEAGRARTGRPLCARRLGAQGRRALRITGQLIDASTARISGPTASTARWKTSSSCRTRSRSASPGSSSRHCKLPKCAAPPLGRPTDLGAYDLYLRALATSFQ